MQLVQSQVQMSSNVDLLYTRLADFLKLDSIIWKFISSMLSVSIWKNVMHACIPARNSDARKSKVACF